MNQLTCRSKKNQSRWCCMLVRENEKQLFGRYLLCSYVTTIIFLISVNMILFCFDKKKKEKKKIKQSFLSSERKKLKLARGSSTGNLSGAL